MKTYTLARSQVIPAPLEDTFRFFEDPRNLAKITPDWLHFEVLDGGRVPLGAGSEIEYRIRWLGIPRRWRTLIEELERPRRFVDVQVRGPYRRWRHEHRFEAAGRTTVMWDRVEYELPGGILGRLVHWAIVSRQLRRIFDWRAARVGEIFSGIGGGDSDAGPLS